MVYYQIEFLWDKRGGFTFDAQGYITGMNLTPSHPYWALMGGRRIITKTEAIRHAERLIEEEDKGILHDKQARAYQMANYPEYDKEYIIKPSHETPFRVVEVSRDERRMVWLDPRMKR